MAEQQAAQAAQEAHNAGLWGFLGVLVTGLTGLVGMRLKGPKKPQPPALSLHNLVLEMRTTLNDVKDKVDEQSERLTRLEERQVTKDAFGLAQKEARDHTDKLVGEMHAEFNEHIRDHATKAA